MKASISLLALLGTAAAVPTKRHKLHGVVEGKNKLTFSGNGTFKILSFSDTHLGQRTGDGWQNFDNQTRTVLETVIDQELPDYVVFNGDILQGEDIIDGNPRDSLDVAFQVPYSKGIPFSTTQGNHDNAPRVNHGDIIQHEQNTYGDLSYTRSDVGEAPYGHGNYWVPVYAKEEDEAPVVILWFFDSRYSATGERPLPGAEENWVDDEVVPPYIRDQTEIMKSTWGQLPPSLVFVHYPFQATITLPHLPVEGNTDDIPLDVQGFKNGTYTALDRPVFNEIRNLAEEKHKLLAVVSGHQHGSSFCGRDNNTIGVTYWQVHAHDRSFDADAFSFNGHSGYGGYRTPNSNTRNGRVFDLNLDALLSDSPSVDTWNSYENKTVGQFVTLNETFFEEYI